MINESQAANSSGQLDRLQFKPTSEASQRYLANHVGDIQRAVVVDVTLRSNSTASGSIQSHQSPHHSSKAVIYDVVLKIGHQKITVESPLLPRIGQQLDILIVNHQQIKLLRVLDKQASLESYKQSQTVISDKSIISHKAESPAISQSAIALPKIINSQQQAIIMNALRSHLPRRNDTLELSSLNTMLDKLPQVNKEISMATLQLRQSINPLGQLTDPLRLAQAIKNSGVLLESKLRQLLSTGEKITVDHLLSLGLLVNAGTTNGKTTDFKLSLLNLITALSRHRGTDKLLKNTQNPPINLNQLWNTLTDLMSRSDALSVNTSNKGQEILPLLRLLLSLVSRVQSQQLTTLNTQQSMSDNTGSLLFELPVWIDQKISMLELRLQWDKSNSAKDQLQGQRIWNAKLSFDCGSAGQLISMISLRGKKCAAVFWAPNADIKTKVSSSLDDLNEVLTQQGMIVDKLQCVLGIPKNNSNNMSITNLLDTNI